MSADSKRADYGFDAPTTVGLFLVLGILLIGFGYILQSHILPFEIPFFDDSSFYWGGAWTMSGGLWMIVGSRILKFHVRDRIIKKLNLNGQEQTLDVGCGRGLLLIGAAKALSSGKAHGIDIWQTVDQSGNDPKVTLENAKRENVLSKIEIVTGDAREMPFENSRFDAVTSSWAIHNIPTKEGREKALSEMIRVLKPGGQMAFLDIKFNSEYHKFFKSRKDVQFKREGPDLTFFIPGYLFLVKKN